MGVILVVGVMLYSVGMCRFFQRFSGPPPVEARVEDGWDGPVVIPDVVPAEWVETYRTDLGG